MFNQHHRAKTIEDFLKFLGVQPLEVPEHLSDNDYQDISIITFFLTIDNHLKLKKIMDQFQDFVTSLQNENAVIANLGTAVAGLATTLQQVKTQLDTAAAQGMHIPAQQAQELSDLIGKGTSDASTALATAQAALTPATPAADLNPGTGSSTDAGSTGSESGSVSTDGSTPPAATDAVNG